MTFKLLLELETQNIKLNDNQKIVLIVASVSATAKQAYEITSGHLDLLYARDMLVRLDYVNVYDSELSLTPTGERQLIDHNLIDETGNLTPDGEQLMNSKFPNSPEQIS